MPNVSVTFPASCVASQAAQAQVVVSELPKGYRIAYVTLDTNIPNFPFPLALGIVSLMMPPPLTAFVRWVFGPQTYVITPTLHLFDANWAYSTVAGAPVSVNVAAG